MLFHWIQQTPGTKLKTHCADGLDNDSNGLSDCCDPRCALTASCLAESQCGDGQDNDCDRLVDCWDGDCDGQSQCEHSIELSCADGDNDADGNIDCSDEDCDGFSDCEHQTELSCDDLLDNDADGDTDCADTDCAASGECLDEDGDGIVHYLDCDDADPSIGSIISIDPLEANGPNYVSSIGSLTHPNFRSFDTLLTAVDDVDHFSFNFIPSTVVTSTSAIWEYDRILCYSSSNVWMELYQYGVLVDSGSGMIYYQAILSTPFRSHLRIQEQCLAHCRILLSATPSTNG